MNRPTSPESSSRGPVAYLVFLEPLWSEVLATQVLDVLEEMADATGEAPLLVWFYRPDWIVRYRERLRIVEERLSEKGVRLVRFPVLAKGRMTHAALDGLGVTQAATWLTYLRARRRIGAFHARSYPPALAIALLKRLGVDVRLLFDPRSPAPEELVAAGTWTRDGFSFRAWKRAERFVLRAADAVVTTTRAMEADLRAVLPDADGARRWAVIPNNVPAEAVPEHEPVPEQATATDAPTIAYMGSLSARSWNNVATYAAFVKRVRSRCPDWRFLFLVPDVHLPEVVRYFRDADLDDPGVAVRSVRPEEVRAALAPCTVGLQIMDHRDSRMGIKVAEYLGAGLPILASETVRGAVEVIEDYGVGFVLEAGGANLDEAIAYVERVARERHRTKSVCTEVARARFASSAVAERYLELYRALRSA